MSRRPKSALDARSWPIANWPAEVFPNDPSKGRHLVRSKRTELVAAGALVRVGRQLVILGGPYDIWMRKKAFEVLDFECPANRAKHPPPQ